MKILGNRILVSRVDEPKKEGFQTVDVQDSFVYKGKVEDTGYELTFSNSSDSANFTKAIAKGAIVLFAKYSPDTQEVDFEGQKMKIIKIEDVLAIL